MPLSAITDPAAVRSAIAEYDHLGQEVFLRTYGFGRSHKYFLAYGGREYDSNLRVEVKGTTGGAASVLLTANEVQHAREFAEHVVLFVVSGIVLHREPGAAPRASGGIPHVFEPWNIDGCALRPVAYECVLPV
jgi:hypothetical protein